MERFNRPPGPVPPKTVPRGIVAQTPKRQRTYDQSFIQYGFTIVMEGNEEKPKCLLCRKVLSAESMKPNKPKTFETTNNEHVGKPRAFFENKFADRTNSKCSISKRLWLLVNGPWKLLLRWAISLLGIWSHIAWHMKPHRDFNIASCHRNGENDVEGRSSKNN